MIDFWDIEFDEISNDDGDNFIEGLLKLGFKRKNQSIFVKDIINHHGNKIDDGLFFDLSNKELVYYPEPNSGITIKGIGDDIEKIDEFIRKNVL